MKAREPLDGAPSDPFCRPDLTGIFRDHACWRCNDGAKPCAQGHPNRCDYPHARND